MAIKGDLNELYEKFLRGRCDTEEIHRLMKLFNAAEPGALEELILQKLADDTAIVIDDQDHSARYERILTNLQQKIAHDRQPSNRIWLKIAIAACITVFISVCTYLYIAKQNSGPSLIAEHTVKIDVKPGGNKAYLTLSTGRKITLANVASGIISSEAGENALKTGDGELKYAEMHGNHTPSAEVMNTLETPNGGQYKVTLSDGTRVWLNAASSLKYPTSFKHLKERRITLTGEAYFEVTKDNTRPFIVQTDDQQISVLGTHFNVNAYHDNGGSKTTLLEGSVKAMTNTSAAIIRPGQQVITDSQGQLKVNETDIELAIAWKNDQFMFDSEPIQQLMKRLARWYDVDVVYSEAIPATRFNGAISKFENISAVLKILESTGKVHFKIRGRVIYVEQ